MASPFYLGSAHIDTLYKFVEQLQHRVLQGTYDGTPGYLTEAPERYQFHFPDNAQSNGGNCRCGSA